ncbi:MAG TPA: STAS domain-containing protein [Gaiellaceae bacterium]|nr:STAS domain-containing protein [Gaiellaceae bacterium]
MEGPSYSVEQIVPGVLLFQLTGETDLAGDRLLRELDEALGAGTNGIVVDCTRLTFLDTRTIDGLLATLSALGDRLVVVAPEGEIRRVLEVSGLESMLRLCETRAEALRELGVEGGPG